MTFAEFTELNLEQRSDAVLGWGFFLGKCTETEQNKVLYALNGYFAEMIMHQKDGEVTDVVPLKVLTQQHRQFYLIGNDNPFIQSASLAEKG